MRVCGPLLPRPRSVLLNSIDDFDEEIVTLHMDVLIDGAKVTEQESEVAIAVLAMKGWFF